MYRIRFHGRGGQGMKTASRILGTAFFLEGFEVQDAPRYGAERRGAPVFAYVRADRQAIHERGIIRHPDLVIVADDSLIAMPAAGVLQGVVAQTLVVIQSREPAQEWQHRLNLAGPVFILPEVEKNTDRPALRYIGAACAAAAARLVGVISQTALEQALRDELAELGDTVVEANLDHAQQVYAHPSLRQGQVAPGPVVAVEGYARPEWVELPFEDARVSAPAIHAGLTSEQVQTGLWRTLRPVIDCARCKHCWWVCSNSCPDGAIRVDEAGRPRIDYAHCKGCMVCAAQCPHHAIEAIAERDAASAEDTGGSK